MQIHGRDLYSGLPKSIKITDEEIRFALSKTINIIVDNIKTTIEKTPPDLVSEIYTRGIALCGGGANIKNLDKLIQQETKVPTNIVDDPLTTVVRGTGIILEDIENLKDLLIDSYKN
jgi:rod shape-determining protein MreB